MIAGSRSWHDPHRHYDNEPETRATFTLIFSDYVSRDEPGIFAPLRDLLLAHGDHYVHLADLESYLEADQRLTALYTDQDAWARKAGYPERGRLREILQRPHDRPICTEIWQAKSCAVA